MTSKKIFLYALFLSFVFCAIYMEAQDTNEEEAITKTIQNAIGWANNKDINLLYNIIADDDKFLEVHPGDKAVKGIRSLKMLKFWMNPDSKAVRYEIKDLNITISKSGYVAWWFCILDDINEWKGKPANWENNRWTGLMGKIDEKWKIVQQHFPFAKD